MAESCRICQTRRPKRNCPGVAGAICASCCGDQREVNISCPLDCPYLEEAHRRERPPQISFEALPNKDIRVSDDFLSSQQELVTFCFYTFGDAALRTPGAVDGDILSAVEAVIRTYRTSESGLVYETRPDDKIAGAVQDQFTRSFAELQKQRSAESGLSPFRDADVMRCLVFLQRYALMQQNGRPRGRAFIRFVQRGLKIPRPQSMTAAAG
jgi:hypothetical protein